METQKIKSWIETWTENYKGESEISRTITMKLTYKNNSYIGWAVMERVLLQLDPDSKITLVRNEQGGFVHTEKQVLRNPQQGGTYLEVEIISHFVQIAVSFMGKEFEENFPIQDNAYNAVRAFDQNLVNKAIQRAKAKVISRATGIGWALYETGDLQYELDEKAPTKPSVEAPQTTPSADTKAPKTKAAVEPKKATEPASVDAPVEATDGVLEVFELLHTVEASKAQNVLDFVNKPLMKQYNKSLTLVQTIDELRDVFTSTAKPDVLIKSIKTQLGAI